jgi:hypothetical protein
MCDCLTFRCPPSRSLGHLQSVPFHTQCRHLHAQTSAARQYAHVRTHPGSAACTPTHTGTHTHTRRDAHTHTHIHTHTYKRLTDPQQSQRRHTQKLPYAHPPPHTHTRSCAYMQATMHWHMTLACTYTCSIPGPKKTDRHTHVQA